MNKEKIFMECSEYSTTNMQEVKFLKANNIRYSFVKVINGVTVYKYKKNKKLFEALSKFQKF